LNIVSSALSVATSWANFRLARTASTPNDLAANINEITQRAESLHTAITSFAKGGQAGTLREALGMYTSGQALVATINRATDTAKAMTPKPVSLSEGEAMFTVLITIVRLGKEAFAQLQAKKEALMDLVPGALTLFEDPKIMISAFLVNIHKSFTGFQEAWILVAPPEINKQVEALGANMDKHIGDAIVCFRS